MKKILFICLLSVLSCMDNNQTNNKSDLQQLPETPITTVKTMLLKETMFYYDILSNGKLSAPQKVDLFFQNNSERIKSIMAKNGQRVKKGQLIAEQEKFKFETALKHSEIQLNHSQLELQNILIGQSSKYLSDSSTVAPNVMKAARLRSGLDRAEVDYKLALHNYNAAAIYAPFDGIIANLFITSGNLPPAGTAFCTILDYNNLNVDFTILENELGVVRHGDKVIVETYTEGILTEGVISDINPIVEKTGLVKIKATIKNAKASLFEGMNVKVKIRKQLDKRIVIPKTALVLRDNRQVVFSIKDNKAQWHYVNTELENSNSYTLRITDDNTLFPGEQIIIEGNINLAHQTPVLIKND